MDTECLSECHQDDIRLGNHPSLSPGLTNGEVKHIEPHGQSDRQSNWINIHIANMLFGQMGRGGSRSNECRVNFAFGDRLFLTL